MCMPTFPGPTITCTSTGTASMPWNATVRTRETMLPRPVDRVPRSSFTRTIARRAQIGSRGKNNTGTLRRPSSFCDRAASQAPCGCLFELRLDLLHLVRAHLADRRDLAVLDPPQAERTGDVAVLVEADRADDPFVLDRFAFLDQRQCLCELFLAGMDRRATGRHNLGDGGLDGGGVSLARLGDGQRDDGARVIGAVGSRSVRLDAARERLVFPAEIFRRGGGRGSRGRAV